MLHANGSGDGVGSHPKVPSESEDKTTGTNEGIGTKPGVPDVPSYKSDSDNESWGDSDDINDDDEDDDNINDDDSENEDDDGNDVHDSERTNSDDVDENPSFTLKDIMKKNMIKNVRSLRAEHKIERKGDEEMIDADRNVSQEKSYEQVVEDAHVTLTSSQKTKSSKQSSSVSSDFASKFLILDNKALLFHLASLV
uniref:Uncharacterized protein n=1 Tax=Tanacetum cinerariifolium TaxID=118510 RepID=A0A6L2KBL0_TANCI|nr:hypothetical protein [Tanacetum cinerariifolium]